MSDDVNRESFEAFKDSFYYGSRADLNFKFLKALSAPEAARFFQELLSKLGDTFDDGQLERIVEHVYQAQIQAYSEPKPWAYDDGPFCELTKPLAASRLALIASTGHFVLGDDPQPFGEEQMTQEQATERLGDFLRAEPELSWIPIDTPRERLCVRHPGYDVRGVRADPNVAFPYELLRELEAEGLIGALAPVAYSFVGACSQLRLLKTSGPRWIELFKQAQVDAALLVPV